MVMVFWDIRISCLYNKSGWRRKKKIFLGLLSVMKVSIKEKKRSAFSKTIIALLHPLHNYMW